MIAYWFECKACGHSGDMKAYEDEMERIAVKVTKIALELFGFIYEKEERTQRGSKPRSDHVRELCEACRLKICKYKKKTKGSKQKPV